LSTVHWVATREGALTYEQALDLMYKWGERKRMFKPEHIQAAWRVLGHKGWLLVQQEPHG